MNSPVQVSRQEAVALLQIDHPPVNTLSLAVRTALLEALAAALGDPAIEAVFIAGAGRCFSAGADITEFSDLAGGALASADPLGITALLDRAEKPVLALLHGTVLGGGLEVALGCHHRLAQAGTQLGLPEIKLGLLPGAGGTQRLPRLVGLQQAARMILSGDAVDAQQAAAIGLVDAVIEGDLVAGAHAYLAGLLPEQRLRRVRDLAPPTAQAEVAELCRKVPRAQAHAARAISKCLDAVVQLPFDEGTRLERDCFLACNASPQAAALQHGFFAQRRAARIPGLPAGLGERRIQSVGVVGGGTMGRGIAIAIANAGLPVTLLEVSKVRGEEAVQAIRQEYERQRAAGRLSGQEASLRSARVRGTDDPTGLAECDLVIEAVFEDLAVKRETCAQLGKLCKPGAIIASNTSTLDIDLLAQASGRPADFLGLHFFSPAHIMRLLEVVRGASTSAQVLASAMSFARKLGKSPVVSGVCYGFIGNRMLEPYLRETEFLLLEGATPAQIDRALESFGMAMGPCRMMDLAGVDVVAKVVIERGKEGSLPADPLYRIVCRELYQASRYGQKNGKGFYRYEGRTPVEDDEVLASIQDLARRSEVKRRAAIADEEIVERCMLPLVNEGIKVVEEGIAYRPSDVDVVWLAGYGFPAERGGPLYYAQAAGLEQVRDRLRHYGLALGNPHGYWDLSAALDASTLTMPVGSEP